MFNIEHPPAGLLFVQNDAQEGVVDGQRAVIGDKSEPLEFLHDKSTLAPRTPKAMAHRSLRQNSRLRAAIRRSRGGTVRSRRRRRPGSTASAGHLCTAFEICRDYLDSMERPTPACR
jgi:hypothetical protein